MRILKKINDYNTDHFLASALTLRLSYIIRSRTEKRLTDHSKPKVTDKKTARSKLPYQKSKQQNQTACNIINRPTNRLQTPDAKIGSSHRYTRESCNKKPARVTPGICQSARSAKEREREREKRQNRWGRGAAADFIWRAGSCVECQGKVTQCCLIETCHARDVTASWARAKKSRDPAIRFVRPAHTRAICLWA